MKSAAVRLKCTVEGSLLGTPKAKAGLSPGSNQVVYYMQSNFRIPILGTFIKGTMSHAICGSQDDRNSNIHVFFVYALVCDVGVYLEAGAFPPGRWLPDSSLFCVEVLPDCHYP